MSEKGITNAAALVGGTQAWENAGYPMESSDAKTSTQNSSSANNANAQTSPASNANKKP